MPEQRLTLWDYVRRFFRKPLWHFLSVEGKFNRIYRLNKWRDAESFSGPGSNLEQTTALRAALPGLLQELGVKVLLDVPCGDFHWLKEVDLSATSYIGGDIVADLVRANQSAYGNAARAFRKIDLLGGSLPRADLILCRDCLVHLSFRDGLLALDSMRRSGSAHLLATTYTSVEQNRDALTGEWRTINLQKPPYGLPEPLRLIDEQCPDPRYFDKHLGLWRLADLRRP